MNILERYGIRGEDKESLHPLLPVIGIREVSQAIDNAIAPHSMPFYQLIYVDEGELEWWVDGRFYHLSKGDFILVKPYETQGSLQGKMPTGRRYFMQINLYDQQVGEGLSSAERHSIDKLFKDFIPRTLSVGDSFRQPFLKILEAQRKVNEFSRIAVKSGLLDIFNCLFCAQRNYLQKADIAHDDALQLLKKSDAYIEPRLHEHIHIADLAKSAALSETHFRRKLLAASGLSPLKYINAKKLQEARRLLTETDMSITNISVELAFSSSQHFSTRFSTAFSLTPREYRQAFKAVRKRLPISRVSEVAAHIESLFTRR